MSLAILETSSGGQLAGAMVLLYLADPSPTADAIQSRPYHSIRRRLLRTTMQLRHPPDGCRPGWLPGHLTPSDALPSAWRSAAHELAATATTVVQKCHCRGASVTSEDLTHTQDPASSLLHHSLTASQIAAA